MGEAQRSRTIQIRHPRGQVQHGLGAAKWAVLLCVVFVAGQTSDCGPTDPLPSKPRNPLALDCVVNGTQIFIPVDMSIDPDRYITAETGLFVETRVTALVPQDAFCKLADLGYVQADLTQATTTLQIGGASRPIPPQVTMDADNLPLLGLDIVGACFGVYGPEVELEFGPSLVVPWSDGSWTMDFVLTEDGVDVRLSNVEQIGLQTIPEMSLLDFCEPVDKSEPPNGTVDDPEDSPRIAADPDRDGIYDVLATAEHQVRLNVNGYCVGQPCNDANPCTVDHCDPRNKGRCTYDQSANGTACDVDGDFGTCVAGSCIPGSPRQSRNITVACTNNVTADTTIMPATLTVDPQSVVAGLTDDWKLDGVAEFAETFLDAAQGAVPGGVTRVDLVDIQWTVHMRSGAVMPDVTLTSEPLAAQCSLGGGTCSPANDGASVPGRRPNTDCVPTGAFNPCQHLVTLPTSASCTPGGLCDTLDGGLGIKNAQCATNGFCVTGNVRIPLQEQLVSVTPEASGSALIGWDDQSTGATVSANGTYALPAAVFTRPAGPMGIRIDAAGLSIGLDCTMAVDSNGPHGVGVPNQASRTPDSDLISFPVSDTPPPCFAIVCQGGSECIDEYCDDTDGMCYEGPASDGHACDLGTPSLDGACSSGVCVSVCEFLADGTSCNFGGSDGACFGGACVDFCQGVPDATRCDFGGLEGACSAGSCAYICDALPDGASCTFGGEGYEGVCAAGGCVSICDSLNCDDANPCTDDSCSPQDGFCRHQPANPGLSCNGGSGTCQAGVCEFFPIDAPTQTRIITMACTDNITGNTTILPFELTVDPNPGARTLPPCSKVLQCCPSSSLISRKKPSRRGVSVRQYCGRQCNRSGAFRCGWSRRHAGL